MKKFLVVYLISIYDDRNNLKEFIKKYNLYKSGYEHDLLICFKNFNQNDSIFRFQELNDLKFIKYEDLNTFNDYDWGSYLRISKKFSDRIIFFMNCHSYPIVHDWLKKFALNYQENSLVAPAGSYESITSSWLKGSYSNSFLYSVLYGLLNLKNFPIYPNPHIRSNCFMISAKNFTKLILNKKFKYKKLGTWLNESGRNGMTNQIKKLKYKIYIINSDNKKFEIDKWIYSQTYALGDQEKLIISDKFSRIYEKAEINEKKKISKNVWGIN